MTTDSHSGTPAFVSDTPRRIGLIVPSSNTTMETEIPALLDGLAQPHTFHSSRATLHTVDPDSLAAMVEQGDRCAAELADANVDVLAYACLVAVMASGAGAHERIEARLTEVARAAGCAAPVVSSAGALVRTLTELELSRVAVVAPYVPALTDLVIGYLRGYGIDTVDWITLGVADNRAVGCLDPAGLPGHVANLDLGDADGIVLSACVQMPSLAAVAQVEAVTGKPVVTAATATAREIVRALGAGPDSALGGAALRPTVVAG
ncbi:Asp/Glu racemase [Nocardia sp. BMG51109]|uniref:maleate cis-trans isomerase family protein n=1 Tax=Nocardia sp. BMG51109 TaxID=1056816 RepID=UPI0004BA2EB4|nr:Asp/Glu racemase [Nocardia sp. BMG51109]